MYTATIDRNALSGLFDNQKKLDALFDSIFDDDNYFISSSSSSQSDSHSAVYGGAERFPSKQNKAIDALLTIKSHSPYFVALPIVLEIALIWFVASNFL